MVKILKRMAPWWTGRRVTCQCCGSMFELDANDFVNIATNPPQTRCPVCFNSTNVRQELKTSRGETE